MPFSNVRATGSPFSNPLAARRNQQTGEGKEETKLGKLTKKAVIASICEGLSLGHCEANAKDHAQLITKWESMPAAEVIAEAESVFGYMRVNAKGLAE